MNRSHRLTAFCLALVLLAVPALPAMAGEGHMAGKAHMAGGDHMASKSVAATGTVNSIDATEKMVNITHEPIPALGWPGMTMDFQLADGANLQGIESGTKVMFHLRKLASGSYEIESLSAVGE